MSASLPSGRAVSIVGARPAVSRDAAPTGGRRQVVTGFARGLSVIEAFGPANKTMTVADVATHTGLDRAVARRLLLTLVDLGFAHVHERRFELSSRVLRLAYSFLASAGLGGSLQPFLDELASAIGETVSVSVLDEADVVFVARSDIPGRRLAFLVTTGMRLPAFSSASGRVLLAYRPRRDVEQLLARTRIVRHTRHTIMQKRALMAAIDAARANGYAENREETEDGLVGLSVPVTNRAGLVVAALNASTTPTRADGKQVQKVMLPQMMKTAAQLSSMLP